MRLWILYILLFLLPQLSNGQDEVNPEELVGYGCGYGGEMSIPVQKVSRKLGTKKYGLIANLLTSKNAAEKYLSAIVLEHLDSLNLYELNEAEKSKIDDLKKSDERVSYCSGCMIYITRSLSEMFDSEFLIEGRAWIDREINKPIPKLYGIATDGKGNPLSGCNVIIKGTAIGTVTNPCGEFTLPFESDEVTLVFHDMTYVDLRAFEIQLEFSEIDGKQIVFQLGKERKPNDQCGEVEKKLKKYKIR